MNSIELKRHAQQRQFYLLIAGASLAFAIWQLIRARPEQAFRLAAAGAFFLTIEFVVPAVGRRLFKAWMVFAGILGKVNTFILISIVFFLVITPIGVLRRRFARPDEYSETACRKRQSAWFPVTDEHRYGSPF